MVPINENDWKWFDLDNLPKNIYSPIKKFIGEYKKNNLLKY